MSLLSEREKMIITGKAPAATREELLQAAILESNERYEYNAKEILAALHRMESILWIRERARVRKPVYRLRGAVYGVLFALLGCICYKRGF